MFSQESFTFNGTEYTIQPPNVNTRGLFNDWLEKSTISFTRRNKQEFGDDYMPLLKEVAQDGGAKAFTWGTQAWATALNSEEGGQEAAFRTLRQAHPGITRATVAEMWEAPAEEKVYHAQTGEEIPDAQLRTLIVQKILKLINRPNYSSPEKEPGEESPTSK